MYTSSAGRNLIVVVIGACAAIAGLLLVCQKNQSPEWETKLRRVTIQGSQIVALRDFSHALQEYKREHGQPCTDIVNSSGESLLSWRVQLLPYLGDKERELYAGFHLNEPWDSEHNSSFIEQIPVHFDDPRNRVTSEGSIPLHRVTGLGQTRYAMLTTEGDTEIVVLPAREAVIWTKPDTIVSSSFEGADEEDSILLMLHKDGTILRRDGSDPTMEP